MDTVDPCAAKIGESLQVVIGRQPFGLEASHLAAGCGVAIQTVTADDSAPDRIMGQPFSVVDVLLAGETTENRLTNEARLFVADIPATSTIAEHGCGEIRETKRAVQLTIRYQASVGRDAGTVELELDPAVEAQPQMRLLAFTLRVRHSTPALSPLSC